MSKTKNLYLQIFNKSGEDRDNIVVNTILVGYISSDTIIDIESCNKSMFELYKMKKALEESELSDSNKEYWNEQILKGLDICLQDLSIMMVEHEDEKCAES